MNRAKHRITSFALSLAVLLGGMLWQSPMTLQAQAAEQELFSPPPAAPPAPAVSDANELKAAINSMGSGDELTIRMAVDITASYTTGDLSLSGNKELTIDLNGKVLNLTLDSSYGIDSGFVLDLTGEGELNLKVPDGVSLKDAGTAVTVSNLEGRVEVQDDATLVVRGDVTHRFSGSTYSDTIRLEAGGHAEIGGDIRATNAGAVRALGGSAHVGGDITVDATGDAIPGSHLDQTGVTASNGSQVMVEGSIHITSNKGFVTGVAAEIYSTVEVGGDVTVEVISRSDGGSFAGGPVVHGVVASRNSVITIEGAIKGVDESLPQAGYVAFEVGTINPGTSPYGIGIDYVNRKVADCETGTTLEGYRTYAHSYLYTYRGPGIPNPIYHGQPFADSGSFRLSVEDSDPGPGPGTDTYVLTVRAGTGGRVSTGGGRYREGERVSITAMPDSGYSFTGWSATSGDLDDRSGAGTTFTMPAGDATVTATFTRAPLDSSGSSSRDSGGSSTPDAVVSKTQLPASAFSWDGRTLTIDYERITPLGLLSVRWDDVTLTRGTEYSVYEGSVIVLFDEDFMAAQAPGDHTVRVEFLNHTGETTVTVGAAGAIPDAGDNDTYNPNTGGYPDGGMKATDNPNTGDGRGIWPALLLGSLSAAALVIFQRADRTANR